MQFTYSLQTKVFALTKSFSLYAHKRRPDRAEGPLHVQESKLDRAEGPVYVVVDRPDRAEEMSIGPPSWYLSLIHI